MNNDGAKMTTMDIYSKPGTKITFTNAGGYPGQKERASEILQVGQIYTVKYIDIHSSHSYVELEEVQNQTFNTVMFDNIRLV